MSDDHPIIEMLSWRTRLLKKEEIVMVLAALAKMDKKMFTLTDLINMLPKHLHERNKRRSLSSMLSNLAKIGYLSKPSERKWIKNTLSLSHFLSPTLIELSDMEKKLGSLLTDEKVIKLNKSDKR